MLEARVGSAIKFAAWRENFSTAVLHPPIMIADVSLRNSRRKG